MMCFVEIGLLIYGLTLLTKPYIQVGNQVAPQPTPFLMAMPLILQLPMVLIVGFLLGLNENAQASKGRRSEMDAQEFQREYWWVDVAIPAGGAALAAVILAMGLRDAVVVQKPKSKTKSRHDDELLDLDPAGVDEVTLSTREFLARYTSSKDGRLRHEDEEVPLRPASRDSAFDDDHDPDNDPPPPPRKARRVSEPEPEPGYDEPPKSERRNRGSSQDDDFDVWKFKT